MSNTRIFTENKGRMIFETDLTDLLKQSMLGNFTCFYHMTLGLGVK